MANIANYMEQDLKQLGLTDNEIKVYLSLMKIGETAVGSIINDLKIHRQIIYNALDSLEKKNMVEKGLKNNIQHFKLSDPKIIVENLEKQELIARRLSKNIEIELKKSRHEHEINIIEGKENIKRFFINKYKKMSVGSTFYMFLAEAKKFEEIMGEDFIKNTYDKLRAKRQIYSKNLTGESFRTELNLLHPKLNMSLRETRYLPYGMTNPVGTTIWEDSIHFQSFYGDPFIIEIKNKNLRDSYLIHFEFLWKMAKK